MDFQRPWWVRSANFLVFSIFLFSLPNKIFLRMWRGRGVYVARHAQYSFGTSLLNSIQKKTQFSCVFTGANGTIGCLRSNYRSAGTCLWRCCQHSDTDRYGPAVLRHRQRSDKGIEKASIYFVNFVVENAICWCITALHNKQNFHIRMSNFCFDLCLLHLHNYLLKKYDLFLIYTYAIEIENGGF